MKAERPLVAVVGPCAAGKSTLISYLKEQGYPARHVAQEHSYVSDMWLRLAAPDCLIYLDVSYQVSKDRTDSTWQKTIYQKQIERLAHARDHADLILCTDDLKPDEVADIVLEFLDRGAYE